MLHDDENACYYYGKGLEYPVEPQFEYVQMMVIGYGYALLHFRTLMMKLCNFRIFMTNFLFPLILSA